MADLKQQRWNRKQIELHLKSAVADLTPDVQKNFDLTIPQEAVDAAERKRGKVLVLQRTRAIGTLAAACFCLIVAAGGVSTYQNSKVDSVIGIDVNPSVELSVNRKNRVLKAEPHNEDAALLMEDMDLKGVDLNVAVNAVIGSMVTHGYLDDLDNAILVTVTNDSISKADSLRADVVNDIQTTLEERQVTAVVYDQQVIEEDEVKQLAGEYGISYGKAYFLKELISHNDSLSMDDMEVMASLSMEEIAREITERSYAVGGQTKVTEETLALAQETSTAAETIPETLATVPETAETSQIETIQTTEAPSETPAEETETSPADENSGSSQPQSSAAETSSQETEEEPQETVTSEKVKVDYADYEDGVVYVNFKGKVKWKNPTVSVRDEDGNGYSAMLGATDSDYCEIFVTGLEGGRTYTFVLGGIAPKNGKATTARGTFETPVIGDGQADEETEETAATEVPETTETESTSELAESRETTAMPEPE